VFAQQGGEGGGWEHAESMRRKRYEAESRPATPGSTANAYASRLARRDSMSAAFGCKPPEAASCRDQLAPLRRGFSFNLRSRPALVVVHLTNFRGETIKALRNGALVDNARSGSCVGRLKPRHQCGDTKREGADSQDNRPRCGDVPPVRSHLKRPLGKACYARIVCPEMRRSVAFD
jgi:hypothetical protein